MPARHPLPKKVSTACSCLQDKRLEEAAALRRGLEAQLQQQSAQLAASSVSQQQQQVDALQQRLKGEQAARAAAEAETAALREALDQGREWVQQAQEQQAEAERLRAEIRRLQVKVFTSGTWCHAGTVANTDTPCGYVALAIAQSCALLGALVCQLGLWQYWGQQRGGRAIGGFVHFRLPGGLLCMRFRSSVPCVKMREASLHEREAQHLLIRVKSWQA